VFGKVVSGMEHVDRIKQGDKMKTSRSGGLSRWRVAARVAAAPWWTAAAPPRDARRCGGRARAHRRGGAARWRPADRVIDASGKVVSPGFIDMHSHSDLFYFACPSAESKVRRA
jgi:hypothetical protein